MVLQSVVSEVYRVWVDYLAWVASQEVLVDHLVLAVVSQVSVAYLALAVLAVLAVLVVSAVLVVMEELRALVVKVQSAVCPSVLELRRQLILAVD